MDRNTGKPYSQYPATFCIGVRPHARLRNNKLNRVLTNEANVALCFTLLVQTAGESWTVRLM
jgi:hypothetical protein